MMGNTFSPEDVGLLKMLLDEWKGCQEDLQKLILKLEVFPDDVELANDLIQRVHCIKRGSSFVGLAFITKLSHEIERAIDAALEKNIKVDSELIDHLLAGVDLLSNHISRLIRKVESYDSSNEEAELVIDFEDEKSIDEFVEKNKCNI